MNLNLMWRQARPNQPVCEQCGKIIIFRDERRGHFCPDCEREHDNGTIQQEQETRLPDVQRG
jgi:predicted RNA-binding Zn-ribbon protein involved in translation (DUF1610 family)